MMGRLFYLLLGLVGLVLSLVGFAVPLLPAFPFVVLTVFGLARSSERLHKWFLSTKVYKETFASYLEGRGMTRHAKVRLIISVTITISIGFVMMGPILLGRLVLSAVWFGHILYFLFKVKTIPDMG